jgi:cell division protease FtsH
MVLELHHIYLEFNTILTYLSIIGGLYLKMKIPSIFKKTLIWLITFVIFLSVGGYFIHSYLEKSNIKEVAYTDFMKDIEDKRVKKVVINLNNTKFTFYDNKNIKYKTDNPKDKDFKKFLLEKGIDVDEKTSINIATIVSVLLLILSASVFYFVFWTDKGNLKKASEPINKIPDVNFNNVAGHSEAIQDIKVLVDFLKNPQTYINSGAEMPRGIIFYGEPGTGKTLTAKAIAGEAKVPFFSISGSDFMEIYVGVGAKRVRSLFAQARKKAPCIIFIDEIDSIGKSRTEKSFSENDQTLNALLTEMDGFEGNEGILVIASTNRLDVLDSALTRAGRFDKHIKIELPDQTARLEILNLHASNKKLAKNISLEKLSKQTIGFSGSDLKSLLNESAIISITLGKDEIDDECIDKAFYQKLLKGHQKPINNRSDAELRLIAWHEAGHALVAKLTKAYEIPKVTIIPSTSGAGGVTFTVPKRMGLTSKKELYNQIKVKYAGRVAEFLLLGDKDSITDGAYNDIEQATHIIHDIITSYGMSDEIGYLNLSIINASDEHVMKVASKLSKELYEDTEKLLTLNKDLLESIANALIERETLSESDLDEIMLGQP